VNRLAAQSPRSESRPRAGNRGGANATLLVLVALFLCLAAVGYWFFAASKRSQTATKEASANPAASQLSEVTRTVLGRLDSPVEIRFYSILDPASVPASVSAFSGRVDQLLSTYQQEAGGKVKVTRFDSQANASQNVPGADGIQAFNLDKGEPCFLGLALVFKGRKESLARLSPDYEQALEADITRAIARLEGAAQPVAAPTAVSQVNTAAVQEVKALIPDLAAVSLDEGRRILQTAVLNDVNLVKKETDAQVKEAEQRYHQALAGASEADKQAARQQLEQVQAEQKQKLDELYTKSAAQIHAFEQLKAAAH
jgi:hypothetical protein